MYHNSYAMLIMVRKKTPRNSLMVAFGLGSYAYPHNESKLSVSLYL